MTNQEKREYAKQEVRAAIRAACDNKGTDEFTDAWKVTYVPNAGHTSKIGHLKEENLSRFPDLIDSLASQEGLEVGFVAVHAETMVHIELNENGTKACEVVLQPLYDDSYSIGMNFIAKHKM